MLSYQKKKKILTKQCLLIQRTPTCTAEFVMLQFSFNFTKLNAQLPKKKKKKF